MDEKYKLIKDNYYIIHNQNGLNNAIQEHFGENWRVEYREVKNFPTKYPALVCMNTYYNGGSYDINLNAINLDEINKLLK